jgi:hypothetical protein
VRDYVPIVSGLLRRVLVKHQINLLLVSALCSTELLLDESGVLIGSLVDMVPGERFELPKAYAR